MMHQYQHDGKRHPPTTVTTAAATQMAMPSSHARSARSSGTTSPATVDTCA